MIHYEVRGVELSIGDHPEVYPPAEDTFLLMEALEPGHRTVLELGTGTGIIAIFCARKGAFVTATDINPHALRLARRNAAANGVSIEFIRADLFEGIRGVFDLVVFNPPYLPTAPEDVTGDRWLDASVSGGSDGLATIKRFFTGLGQHLAVDGLAYVLTSSNSGPNVPLPRQFRSRVVASTALEFETLRVHEISRAPGPAARDRIKERGPPAPIRARGDGGRAV